MDSDAEKGLRYRQRAEELLKIAATIPDLKSKQIIIEAAEDYLRLSVSFVEP